MAYQVTCVCGEKMTVGADQFGQVVNCSACGRALLPTAPPMMNQPIEVQAAVVADDFPTDIPEMAPTPAAPASVASPTPAVTASVSKPCPLCGEMIMATAKKCKHCGEYLDSPAARQAVAAQVEAGEVIFELTVSQWDNAFKYLVCLILLGLAVVGVLYLPPLKPFLPEVTAAGIFLCSLLMWIFYISTRSSRCTIRSTRIDTQMGILNRKYDSVDLMRVHDVQLQQSLLQRMLGVGTVVIQSSDPTTPVLELYMIPQARAVYDYIITRLPEIARERRAMVVTER
ncbi:MAG: PH domain-containing protein [Phycisphaerae bacterium]